MHTGTLALERQVGHGYAVGKQFVVVFKALGVVGREALLEYVGKLQLGWRQLLAFKGRDKLTAKRFGRAAVKGNMMHRDVQQGSVLGKLIHHRPHRDACA